MEYLRQEMGITREGVSLKGICVAAREIGMQTTACRMSMGSLCEDVTLPCIIHWNQNHFVVVYKIAHGKVYVADPGKGMIHYSMAEFASHWTTDSNEAQATGIALLLEPTDGFYAKPGIKERRGRGMVLLRQYATRYRGDMARLLLGLFAVSGIQLLFPFLTQAIVDRGISGRDMHIIWLILLGEVALLTGSTVIDFVRRRILLRVSTQVNISLISDFFTKLMRLPIAFFGYKQTGDLLQRIEDHSRIEQFLTTQAPNVIFAAFSVVTLCTVLGVYSMSILGVFAAGSVLYMLWIMLFLRRRRTSFMLLYFRSWYTVARSLTSSFFSTSSVTLTVSLRYALRQTHTSTTAADAIAPSFAARMAPEVFEGEIGMPGCLSISSVAELSVFSASSP